MPGVPSTVVRWRVAAHVVGTLVTLLVVAWEPPAAAAEDVRVDAHTVFRAYEVRSPGTAALLARRRLVQTLGVTWSRPVAERDEGHPAPRLTASARLRLDQDFGDDCLVGRDLCFVATEPRTPEFWQPLAEDTRIEAPEVWVGIDGLPWSLEGRLGRQLHLDPIGFLRIDGASARVAPRSWVAASAYGGLVVRRTSLGGSDTFAPHGAIRLDFDEDEAMRPRFADEPTTTWAVGGEVALGRVRWVQGRAGFREVRDGDGLVARYASLALASAPVDALRLEALGVLDVHRREVSDAMATVTVRPAPRWELRAQVEHHRPRFDYGTIWAYFDLVPISEALLGAAWDVREDLEVGAALRGRTADFEQRPRELDAGAEGHVRFRLWGARARVSAFAWGGDLGPSAAALLDLSRAFGSQVRGELRTSVWYFDDPLREGLNGASVSEAVGVRVRLSDATHLRFEVEHAYNRVVRHRFRGLGALHVEVWR